MADENKKVTAEDVAKALKMNFAIVAAAELTQGEMRKSLFAAKWENTCKNASCVFMFVGVGGLFSAVLSNPPADQPIGAAYIASLAAMAAGIFGGMILFEHAPKVEDARRKISDKAGNNLLKKLQAEDKLTPNV